MWLKAEPSPTSTTPEDENDYEAVRARFYGEGWDEGRRHRKAGPTEPAVPPDWYDKDDKGDRPETRKSDQPPPQKPGPRRATVILPTPATAPVPQEPPRAPQASKDTRASQDPVPVKTASVAPPTRAVTEPRETATPTVPERREPPPLQSPAPETRAAVTEARDALNRLRAQMEAEEPNEWAAKESAPKESVTKESTVTETAQKDSAPEKTPPVPRAAEAASEPLIRIETPADYVALLTLNTPKIRNALTADMRMALRGALKALATDDRVHVLIITGADGNFCAGGDVRTMGETDPHKIRQRMTEVAETAEAVASFPKPVIAAVAGHAAGAGVSLACLADIIVVDESAQFTFSFLRLALGPDWGLSWSLPRRVGATKARGLILSRGVIDAREAQQIGLADQFASEGEVRFAAIEIAKQLCNGPREATAAVKTMLGDLDGLRKALAAETAMQLERFPAWEHQEGAAAFKEKRAADYTRRPK